MNRNIHILMINIHIISPIIYCLLVKFIMILPSCPKSKIMTTCRNIHNIFLSILSFIMLVGITYANYRTDKLYPLNTMICKSYEYDKYAFWSAKTCLYSKYLEYFDTLFLHLSGKPISMLQYTHHMSTAFLLYMNSMDYISPYYFIPMSLNCFAHIWMYWYFAFPKGVLYKYRKMITQFQILQHIICVLVTIYVYIVSRKFDCQQNKYGNESGFLMYVMYFTYFALFYVKSYFKKKK